MSCVERNDACMSGSSVTTSANTQTNKHNLSSWRKCRSAPVQASITQNRQENTKQENLFTFAMWTYPHYILWHCTVTQPVSPASPLFPCTDNDCIWSHSFIFYIMIGASICFLGSFIIFVLLFWKRFWSVSVFGMRESVCLHCSLLNVCVWVCVWEWEGEYDWVCCCFGGSVFSSQCTSALLPVFIIVPVCSGVSLCLLHPFIQTKERKRENGRWRGGRGGRRPFPSTKNNKKTKQKVGEKNTNEEKGYFWKTDIFLLCGGHKEECTFLS